MSDQWKVKHSTFSIDTDMTPPHWFEHKAVHFSPGGSRRPKSLREWARCFWNCDIFYGPVPATKTIAAISWLIAWLT